MSQPLFEAVTQTSDLFKPDDDQLAIELSKAFADDVSFFYNSWRSYQSGVWASRDNAEMRRYIRTQLRKYRAKGVQVSQRRITSIAAMLEDDLFISDRKIIETFPEQRRYVNLRNGLFNLESMELEPHRPDLYFTSQLDFDYDPDADCPTFSKYLTSSLVYEDTGKPDPDLIMLMKQALGYSMTARTDLKLSFWLIGKKDSGKSTFVSLLKNLFGSLYGTIDMNQLGTNRFLLAGIVGKRVIGFTEGSSNTFLPDGLYKALVGGSDEIYADVKNRDAIAFVPECKVWWAMNDGQLPRISDRSGATTRRIVIIPFNRSIPENKRIQNLEQLLMRERAGIFNEMVFGYKCILNGRTFDKCEQSNAAREQYIMENDTEMTYIEERGETHESYRITSAALYQDYSSWCMERGFKPKNINQLAGEWRRLGFVHERSNGAWWRGVRLKQIAN
jgi:putative DNA primase/helicase